MKVVLFCHSLLSDWNHGSAHFLRGLMKEFLARGHEEQAFEPVDAWSVQRLLAEQGEAAIMELLASQPELRSTRYDLATLDLDTALAGASLVLVHEWNDPALVARLGRHRQAGAGYRLLYHDTHHRALTTPEEMARVDLTGYDGVLVHASVLREIYLRDGWAERVRVWPEAADVRTFRPLAREKVERHLVWIGNWGDERREAALRSFLLEPVGDLRLQARVHGSRLPLRARTLLELAGIEYGGWIPDFRVPQAFAAARATVHIPRRVEASGAKHELVALPSIRPFEALACGIPLVSAPWDDYDGLFTPGRDFLVARDGTEMRRHLQSLLADEALARSLAEEGLRTVLAHHTCAHRVDELLEFADLPAQARGRTESAGEDGFLPAPEQDAAHAPALPGGFNPPLRGTPAVSGRAAGHAA